MEIGYQSKDSGRLSTVRKDIIAINDKIEVVGDKVHLLDECLSPIPDRMGEVEYNINSYRGQLDTLEERNNLHSAKLKYLRQEIDHVKLENDVLLGHLRNHERPPQNDSIPVKPVDYIQDFGQLRIEPGRQSRREEDTGRYDDYGQVRIEPGRQSRHEENTGRFDDFGQLRTEPGRQSRREEDTGKFDDSGFQNRGQVIEQRPMTNEQKNEIPDAKLHNNPNYRPVRGESRSSQASSVDDRYKFEELQRQRRREIYGCHDFTAINPQLWEPLPRKGDKLPFDHKKYPHPGGFLFMRFDDSGYDIAKDAIKRMQSICRNAGGYLLGAARKQRIFVYENAPSRQMNWVKCRRQPYSDVLMTENAIAVFWFMRREAACDFLQSTHNNRFREPCFPTPSGYEAFYVPLIVTPPIKPYSCFLFVEFPDARQYATEDMTSFEGEVRHDMTERFPGCLPMIVSALEGKDVFKPGIFVSPYSKLYISRFQSQQDVDDLWKMGMIQGLRYKWNLTGPINVFSFVIDG